MRWLFVIIGVALVGLGAVWTLQGIGVLHGSAMTGVRAWAIIGPIVGAGGLVSLGYGLRHRS